MVYLEEEWKAIADTANLSALQFYDTLLDLKIIPEVCASLFTSLLRFVRSNICTSEILEGGCT